MNKAKNIEKRKASSPRRQSQLDTSITHGQARIEIHKLCDLGFIKKRGQVFRDYRIYTVKNNKSYYFPNNFPYLCRKMKIKNYQIVILELPNGQTRHIPMREFDYYAYPNELEHKEENIIICIGSLAHSFIYETDERGEIVNREAISRISFM